MLKSTHMAGAVMAAFTASGRLLAQSALAEDFIKGGEERFTVNLGGILNQFNTSVALNGGTAQGTPIDLEGHGLDKSLTSLEASGTWRITERNRVDFMYFGAKRSGSRQYDRDIAVGDKVFVADTDVNAEAKDEFLLLDYRYSFYKTEPVEVAGVLGFYGGKFTFDVNGSVAAGGMGATVAGSTSSSTTVPLPLGGVSLDWYIEPRWKVSSLPQGMGAKIGDVDGNVILFGLSTDYMITRNWGLGLAYLYTRVDVDVTKSGFNGNIDWTSNAVLLYATAKF